MPLKDGAVNEILPFAAAGEEGAGDLLSLEAYKAHTMRLRGHQAGLALRELQNREARQATHMAAGLGQFIANRYAPGVVDDADLDKVEEGVRVSIEAECGKLALGIGQAWQSVTSSRTFNTNYTNTTGKPIFVCIQIITDSTSGSGVVTFYVDGNLAAVGTREIYGTQRLSTLYCIIHPGGIYRLETLMPDPRLTHWLELR